jgi:CheY-like chemotaxis protein
MILIVDDDPVMCQYLLDALEMSGYSGRISSNGREAMDMLDAGLNPSLVILDLLMPVMDGNEFLQEMMKRRNEVPVVLITGYLGNLKSAVGVAAILEKPVTAAKVIEAVSALVPKG